VIKLCTVTEIRAAEHVALGDGRTEDELMTSAATGIASLILKRFGDRIGSAVFLVGPGKNGGDGLVAATILVEVGWTCFIWGFKRDGVAGAPISGLAAERLTWIRERSELQNVMSRADLIVDAVFGIGGKIELPQDVAEVFASAREARVARGTPLWAIDVPSGVDADSGEASDSAFHADVTVSIGLPKIGLYRAPAVRYSGDIELVDIGLSAPEATAEDIALIDERSVRTLLPRRRQDTHKHDVGWLLVIGGAPNYYGAPRMAAEAAARAGAGMVSMAVPRSLVAPIASAVREVTFLPLPEAEFGGAGERMAQLVSRRLPEFAACLIGPGLGQDEPVPEFLSRLFGLRSGSQSIGFGSTVDVPQSGGFSGRAVIDADGLNFLAKQESWHETLSSAELVLTPHPGELARLTGTSTADILADPWGSARAAADRFQQVVVLKQGFSVVAAPGQPLLIAPRCDPALASAGTGDVLAGTIAGLMAQGLEPRAAAAVGLFIGSRAADLAETHVGTLSLVAGDVIDTLPEAIRQLYDREW
jgi:NAD(P)H-hydrate epimerase